MKFAADWPFRTDARLCQAEALRAVGQVEEADAILAAERKVIAKDSLFRANLISGIEQRDNSHAEDQGHYYF